MAQEPVPLPSMWESWKKRLASAWASQGCGGHLGGEPVAGNFVSLSLFVTLPFKQINKFLNNQTLETLLKHNFSQNG